MTARSLPTDSMTCIRRGCRRSIKSDGRSQIWCGCSATHRPTVKADASVLSFVQYVRIDAHQSALSIYEELQLWDKVIESYLVLGRKAKVRLVCGLFGR